MVLRDGARESSMKILTMGADLGTPTTSAIAYAKWDKSLILINPSQFKNPTFYFEAVLRNDTGGKITYAELYNETDGASIAGSEVTVTGTSRTRVRSSAINLVAGSKEYLARVKVSDATSVGEINGLRVVVVED